MSTTNNGSGFGLFGPFSRGQCLHRQGMDLGPHSIAQGLVNALVTRNAVLAIELGRDNGREKMLSVAFDRQVFAGQTGGDVGLDLFRRGIGHGVLGSEEGFSA